MSKGVEPKMEGTKATEGEEYKMREGSWLQTKKEDGNRQQSVLPAPPKKREGQ